MNLFSDSIPADLKGDFMSPRVPLYGIASALRYAYPELHISHLKRSHTASGYPYWLCDLSLDDGLPVIRLLDSPDKYKIALMQNWFTSAQPQEFMESANSRYILRKLNTPKAKQRIESTIKGARRKMRPVLMACLHVFQKSEFRNVPDEGVYMDREVQRYAAFVAAGEMPQIAVPERIMSRMKEVVSAWNKYNAEREAANSLSRELFLRDKWLVGAVPSVYTGAELRDRRYFLASVNFTKHLPEFGKEPHGDTIIGAMTTPMKTYTSLESFPDDVRRSIMAKLTLMKIARGGSMATGDENGFFPRNANQVCANTNSITWDSGCAHWLLFDKD